MLLMMVRRLHGESRINPPAEIEQGTLTADCELRDPFCLTLDVVVTDCQEVVMMILSREFKKFNFYYPNVCAPVRPTCKRAVARDLALALGILRPDGIITQHISRSTDCIVKMPQGFSAGVLYGC
jgi:hypothetical protein